MLLTALETGSLELVLGKLDFKLIYRLFMTGDSLLRSRLRRIDHSLSTNLRVCSPELLRSILGGFAVVSDRIRALDITLRALNQKAAPVRDHGLPPHLTRLNLVFAESDTPTNPEAGEFLHRLPSSLLHLILPKTIASCVDQPLDLKYLESLEEIHILSITVSAGASPWDSLPSSLRRINLSTLLVHESSSWSKPPVSFAVLFPRLVHLCTALESFYSPVTPHFTFPDTLRSLELTKIGREIPAASRKEILASLAQAYGAQLSRLEPVGLFRQTLLVHFSGATDLKLVDHNVDWTIDLSTIASRPESQESSSSQPQDAGSVSKASSALMLLPRTISTLALVPLSDWPTPIVTELPTSLDHHCWPPLLQTLRLGAISITNSYTLPQQAFTLDAIPPTVRNLSLAPECTFKDPQLAKPIPLDATRFPYFAGSLAHLLNLETLRIERIPYLPIFNSPLQLPRSITSFKGDSLLAVDPLIFAAREDADQGLHRFNKLQILSLGSSSPTIVARLSPPLPTRGTSGTSTGASEPGSSMTDLERLADLQFERHAAHRLLMYGINSDYIAQLPRSIAELTLRVSPKSKPWNATIIESLPPRLELFLAYYGAGIPFEGNDVSCLKLLPRTIDTFALVPVDGAPSVLPPNFAESLRPSIITDKNLLL